MITILQPVKEFVRPDNQLQLSGTNLEEVLACVLSAVNPAAPSNVAHYSLRERAYKQEQSVDHMLHHYSSAGWLSLADPAGRRASVQVLSCWSICYGRGNVCKI